MCTTLHLTACELQRSMNILRACAKIHTLTKKHAATCMQFVKDSEADAHSSFHVHVGVAQWEQHMYTLCTLAWTRKGCTWIVTWRLPLIKVLWRDLHMTFHTCITVLHDVTIMVHNKHFDVCCVEPPFLPFYPWTFHKCTGKCVPNGYFLMLKV